MSWYPLFFNLRDRAVLIVGGGHVALEKARRLSSFCDHMTIVSPSFLEGFESLSDIHLLHREWQPDDLEETFLVIAASDDHELNLAIAKEAARRRVLCNVVDDLQNSEVIFGSVISRDMLSIGISTSGASPSAAKYLKKEISDMIPDGFDESLVWLAKKRAGIIERFDPKVRHHLFGVLFEACLDQQGPLSEEQFEQVLSYYENKK